METFFESKWSGRVAVLALMVSVLLVYSNTLHSAFQFDDLPNIVKNDRIKDLGNIPAILRGQRGVTALTFAVNYALGGVDTFGYHLVNVSIHIINGVLVYLLLVNTFTLAGAALSWSRKASAFSALVFALHPVQTQAVTYIVQRMESLSSLFYLLALLLFVKAAKVPGAVKRLFLYALVGLSYILGFYSKETALTLPAVILLYDVFFISEGGEGRVRSVLTRWPVYVMLVILLGVFTVKRVVPMGGFNDLSEESMAAEAAPAEEAGLRPAAPPLAGGGPDEVVSKAPDTSAPPLKEESRKPARKRPRSAGFSLKTISPAQYLMTQSNVLLYYYSLLLVPINQNLDYDFPVSRALFETPRAAAGAILNIPLPPPAVSIVIHLFVLALALYLYLRSLKQGSFRLRAVSFFIFWFFIILSPTSSFIPIIDVIYEHRLYLPSLAFSVILVICAEAVFSRVFEKRGPAGLA